MDYSTFGECGKGFIYQSQSKNSLIQSHFELATASNFQAWIYKQILDTNFEAFWKMKIN